MKKIVLAVLCLAGMTAMAQRDGMRGDRSMEDLTSEQQATLQTKKMTLALDLSEDQQERVYALNLENIKMRDTVREERRERKEKGEDSRPTSEERYAHQTKRLDALIAHKSDMKEILSPEQYGRWEKMALRKTRHRNEKREKHRNRG